MTNATSTHRRHPRRGDGDPVDQFAALVWRPADPKPQKLWFDHPVDALTAGVEYLKAGYQVRLTDGAVRYFAELPRPEANGAANGQHHG